MSLYPIPLEALDDRLAWTGTSGSGKTYNAGTGVERLLAAGARVIIIDPLNVWWGLRLAPDGEKPSRFKPVIFGGPRGDLPLTERTGALIGETCARMRESCIISLADFKSAADERRFMLAFLSALYRSASGEPVHIVFDEADLWAPQLILDKDGDATKLLGQMQTIVRRGRIKGFIPWLITQRPAEISKGVLSQADGLMAFTLTGSQDRDAVGAWIKGQADAEVGKAILASLPGLQLGQGVVWIPRRGLLATEQFPPKTTFDSSRTPKRGEVLTTAALKPLDLGALQERLAAVEEEAKANDPKALKATIAKLEADLILARKTIAPGTDPEELKDAERRGYIRGHAEGLSLGWDRACAAAAARSSHALAVLDRPLGDFAPEGAAPADPVAITPLPREASKVALLSRPKRLPPADLSPTAAPALPIGLTGAQVKVLRSLAWWKEAGFAQIDRRRACLMAGLSPKASTFGVYIGQLTSGGYVEVPAPGQLSLTASGEAAAPAPDGGGTLLDAVRALLSPAELKVFDVVVSRFPDAIGRPELADAVGLSRTASTLGVYLGRISSFGFIETRPGQVRAADWLFPEHRHG